MIGTCLGTSCLFIIIMCIANVGSDRDVHHCDEIFLIFLYYESTFLMENECMVNIVHFEHVNMSLISLKCYENKYHLAGSFSC